VPEELERVGVAHFRVGLHGPYRVLYEVGDEAVIVHAVLDGRRELRDLLFRRLVR
jgi:toxin ParE1/3/4